MAAAWFKGVQQICLDYNDTIHKLFHKCVTFVLCLVQEEMVKTGFCHKSVQAASLVVEQRGSCGRDNKGRRRMNDRLRC